MFIDTHIHLDGEEFESDREQVIDRAREVGAVAMFLPAIDLASSRRILMLCQQRSDFLFPMVGLHPEEVKPDYREVLAEIKSLLAPPYLRTSEQRFDSHPSSSTSIIAIGEVGLDFYWSREYENEQLAAFEQQVEWSVETRLPLMIHCRKAQNEMVRLLRRYERELPGGVFHCFTGNEHEALELLQFERFVLGVGGVSTFKKSHLPEVLPACVPLSRLVLETDAPYMAPVPMRGQRNESAYIPYIINKLAESYGVEPQEIGRQTTANAARLFGLTIKEN